MVNVLGGYTIELPHWCVYVCVFVLFVTRRVCIHILSHNLRMYGPAAGVAASVFYFHLEDLARRLTWYQKCTSTKGRRAEAAKRKERRRERPKRKGKCKRREKSAQLQHKTLRCLAFGAVLEFLREIFPLGRKAIKKTLVAAIVIGGNVEG